MASLFKWSRAKRTGSLWRVEAPFKRGDYTVGPTVISNSQSQTSSRFSVNKLRNFTKTLYKMKLKQTNKQKQKLPPDLQLPRIPLCSGRLDSVWALFHLESTAGFSGRGWPRERISPDKTAGRISVISQTFPYLTKKKKKKSRPWTHQIQTHHVPTPSVGLTPSSVFFPSSCRVPAVTRWLINTTTHTCVQSTLAGAQLPAPAQSGVYTLNISDVTLMALMN